MTQKITPVEFAAILNGRDYGSEITEVEEAQAKAAGLVVVFGYSDDNVELRGTINDECGAYEGTTLRITTDGLLETWDSLDEPTEEEAEAYFAKKRLGFKTIEAIWSPEGTGMSWAYETEIPHAPFDVMEDGETYCRGIVFRLADVGA